MMSSCKSTIKSRIERYANSTFSLKILDIGCGDGEYTRLFCRNHNNVIGIDLKMRKSLQGNFTLVTGDAQRLPFKSKVFDIVVSFDVIEHVVNDSAFISEARRVLKKDGKILLGTPNKNRLSHVLLKFIGKEIDYPLYLSEECVHLREYTQEELIRLFENEGFKDIIIHPTWLGLRFTPEIGIVRVPHMLRSYVQYWFVEAVK